MVNFIYLVHSRFAQLDPDICGDCDPGGLPRTPADRSTLQTLLQIAFGVMGAIAVIYIILGGFKLMTSNGDPQALSRARNTIIYAVIGLIVAISAELIVTFVLTTI